jgi:hypothetical protein
MRRVGVVVLSGVLALGAVAFPSPDTALAAKKYPNCKALNKVYPHGVGKPGAKDKVNGKYRPGRSVTTWTKNRAVYNANTARDGDKDGVACEKK